MVGLGNPGKEYTWTRHNFGFLAVSHFAHCHQAEFIKSAKHHGLIACLTAQGRKTHLLLPTTYMNVSGVAVKAIVEDKKIDLSNVLVVCDDLNLDFGELRIRPKGSAGGHNGLVSIIDALQSNEFARLRLGIGTPKTKNQTTDFVLSEFKINEKKRVQDIIGEATDCCNVFLESGIGQAMMRFNKRSNKEEKDDEKI